MIVEGSARLLLPALRLPQRPRGGTRRRVQPTFGFGSSAEGCRREGARTRGRRSRETHLAARRSCRESKLGLFQKPSDTRQIDIVETPRRFALYGRSHFIGLGYNR